MNKIHEERLDYIIIFCNTLSLLHVSFKNQLATTHIIGRPSLDFVMRGAERM